MLTSRFTISPSSIGLQSGMPWQITCALQRLKRHCRARGNRGAVAKSQAPRWPRRTPSWGSGNSSSQKRDGPEKNMGPMAIKTSESQHNDTYKGGIYYANWCQLMPTICTWASISWLFLVVSQNKLYLSGWFFHFFEPIWWHCQTYL